MVCDGDTCSIVPSFQPMSIEDAEAGQKAYIPQQKGTLSVLCNNQLTVPSILSSEDTISQSPHPSMTEYLATKEFVLLYFGASWCPPCRSFSPILSKFALKNKDSVGVVFMSNDVSEDEALKFLKNKYFAYAGFQTQAHMVLNQLLSVTMLPTLVIMDQKTGRMITSWGRSAVTYNSDNCIDDWRQNKSGVSIVKSICTIS